MTKRSGFTLIELVIAISLAMVLCYSAFACLRICSQSTTIVNRLALENQLMRVGVAAALDELDFWTSYDDPRYGARPLTGPNQPFSSFTPPTSDFFDFDQSKPRNWWRGLWPAANWTNWGNYGLVANLAHASADNRREAEFLRTMCDRLGYYALIDYAPANTMFSYYQDGGGQVPAEFTQVACINGRLYGLQTDYTAPRNQRGLSEASAFTLTNNATYHANWDVSRHFFLWWANGVSCPPEFKMDQMYANCGEDIKPLPMRPEHWPSLDIVVRNFFCKIHVHNATVKVADPVSSEQFSLYIATSSTTLRGARRQRGLDGP